MNQQSEHLSSAQIEDYGAHTPGEGLDGDIAVEKHLADCPSCRSRVLEFQRRRLGLIAANLEMPRRSEAGLSEREAGRPDLQDSGDFSPEESALLEQLKSASPDWQRQAARKMLQTRNRGPAPPWVFSWKWAAIPAAAACSVVVLVFWYTRPPTPEKVANLFAQAYTQHRTLEMRWPGAQWAAFSGTLGSDHASPPRSLMEAEEALSKLPATELRQSKWLRAIAEKEIATGNPGAAAILLEPVTNSATAPVELRLDLAIAYFAQGKQTHDTSWYEKSRGELNKVLQQEPGNTVALFNRALILEQFKETLRESEADWMKFLAIETDKRWREEGITNLKNVRELLGK